jgi:hypothetical protein
LTELVEIPKEIFSVNVNSLEIWMERGWMHV